MARRRFVLCDICHAAARDLGRTPAVGADVGSDLLLRSISGYQIASLQRFSIYLGHPTYTLSIILFLMLLFTGLGSLASDRLDLRTNGLFGFVPLLIAITVVGLIVADQPVMNATLLSGLPV